MYSNLTGKKNAMDSALSHLKSGLQNNGLLVWALACKMGLESLLNELLGYHTKLKQTIKIP